MAEGAAWMMAWATTLRQSSAWRAWSLSSPDCRDHWVGGSGDYSRPSVRPASGTLRRAANSKKCRNRKHCHLKHNNNPFTVVVVVHV